ncbi:MAG: hypothetical protein CMI16_06940 [Opitutaceae bacterium]|nr:hypothetical protein [Opitutaceae bacterium]
MSVEFVSANEIDPERHPSLLIVGAGVGGLAVARLCASRYRVTVVERANRVGGLAKTVACGDVVVELGPSHHLSSHENLRALLAYGVPSSPEKSFGESREILHCEERGGTPLDLSSIAEEERDALSRGDRPSRECVPWADETAAFSVGDAAEAASVSDGGEKLTARLGYQRTFSRVRERLEKEENVRFALDTTVASLRRQGEQFAIDPLPGEFFDAVVLACPPEALSKMSLPEDVMARVPTPEQTVPVASSRTVLCFRTVPDALRRLMNPGTHFTSDEDDARGYRWAVVISPTVLMLSYVDGERAERQLRGEVPPGELARSFLASLRRQRLLSGCLTAEQLVENADVHVGGSLHAFHKGAAPPLTPLFLSRPRGVKGGAAPLVGEAYGPTVLRAWMEGACASAAEAARTLNARS